VGCVDVHLANRRMLDHDAAGSLIDVEVAETERPACQVVRDGRRLEQREAREDGQACSQSAAVASRARRTPHMVSRLYLVGSGRERERE
jgi:hypothetical protein